MNDFEYQIYLAKIPTLKTKKAAIEFIKVVITSQYTLMPDLEKIFKLATNVIATHNVTIPPNIINTINSMAGDILADYILNEDFSSLDDTFKFSTTTISTTRARALILLHNKYIPYHTKYLLTKHIRSTYE